MKRQWKRTLSILLSLVMLFSMTGMNMVYATRAAITTRTQTLNLIDEIRDNNGGPITAISGVYDMLAAEGWKWDSNTNTLILNNANIEVGSGNAIALPADATIEFLGENSVKSSDLPTIDGVDGLTLSGSGSINISGKYAGVLSDQITITSGTVNVTADSDSAILARDTLEISGVANVTARGYWCGMQANGSGIAISGATVVTASTNDAAVYTKGTLTVSGSAHVTATDSLYAGINATGGITITDSTVKAGSGTNYTAIYTPQSVVLGGAAKVTANGDFVGILGEASVSIDGRAEVTVTGKSTGLQSMDTRISGSAVVNATSANASAISGKDNLSITENAEVTATGAQAGIVSNGSMTLSAKDIMATGGWYGIDNEGGNASGITIGGKLTAEATTAGHGIYSIKSITANNNADITATGAYSGVSAGGDIAFTGSKVDAMGKGGCGITSFEKITVTGGSIHAKGSSGYTAIRAENIRTSGETAVSQIFLTNVIEKSGAKVAFSDWVANAGRTVSWTSFIPENDSGLAMVEGGFFTNGLREVWLAEPATVTFDVNGGSGQNSTVDVYPGNKVTAPEIDPTKDGCHFSGWYLDSTQFDFVNTAITGDITLKAKLDAHTPNADDGDCTTAITCSVCGVETTAAKAHALSGWQKDETNHWKKCTNTGCTHTEQSAAHTWNGGMETTPPTHTQDGVKIYTCTVCGQTKTEAVPKLPSKPVIEDSSTGVKAEYEDGTPFDADIVLNITSKSQAEMDLYKAAVDKAAPGFTLGGLYDITLLKDGVAIQPNGKIKVSIPPTDAMKAMTDLRIVYINDDGNATVIPSQVVDGKIIFVTDHFSYYGVIGKVKATATGDNNGDGDNSQNSNSPQTGDRSPMLLFVLMMGISGTALVILGKKRKVFKRPKK